MAKEKLTRDLRPSVSGGEAVARDNDAVAAGGDELPDSGGEKLRHDSAPGLTQIHS